MQVVRLENTRENTHFSQAKCLNVVDLISSRLFLFTMSGSFQILVRQRSSIDHDILQEQRRQQQASLEIAALKRQRCVCSP